MRGRISGYRYAPRISSEPMYLQFLRDLYTHMAWADATVWETVLSSSGVEDDESLQDTLVHLHLVQRAVER